MAAALDATPPSALAARFIGASPVDGDYRCRFFVPTPPSAPMLMISVPPSGSRRTTPASLSQCLERATVTFR